jgi:hypothetical protein
MNTFASRLIASKMSLLDFIDLSLEDKLASFGLLVGSERMVRRFSAMFNDSSTIKANILYNIHRQISTMRVALGGGVATTVQRARLVCWS